jgi:cobalt-zinc-cadmium efflux system protein
VLVDSGSDCHALRRDIEHVLTSDCAITHTTLLWTTPARHLRWGRPSRRRSFPPLAEAHCDDIREPVHRDEQHAH